MFEKNDEIYDFNYYIEDNNELRLNCTKFSNSGDEIDRNDVLLFSNPPTNLSITSVRSIVEANDKIYVLSNYFQSGAQLKIFVFDLDMNLVTDFNVPDNGDGHTFSPSTLLKIDENQVSVHFVTSNNLNHYFINTNNNNLSSISQIDFSLLNLTSTSINYQNIIPQTNTMFNVFSFMDGEVSGSKTYLYFNKNSNSSIVVALENHNTFDYEFSFNNYVAADIALYDNSFFLLMNNSDSTKVVKTDINGNIDNEYSFQKNNYGDHSGLRIKVFNGNVYAFFLYTSLYERYESTVKEFDANLNVVQSDYLKATPVDVIKDNNTFILKSFSKNNLFNFCENNYIDYASILQGLSSFENAKDGLFNEKIYKTENNIYSFLSGADLLRTNTFTSSYSILRDSSLVSLLFNENIAIGMRDSQTGEKYYTGSVNLNTYVGPYGAHNLSAHERSKRWNTLWFVTKDMIDNHIQAFMNNDPTYEIPPSILYWPAHGDVSSGEPQNIAPFKDINNDGSYQPKLGEYPLIKGDWSSFGVSNDIPVDNGCPVYDNGIGLNFTEMIFGFDCENDSSLNHTIFKDLQVINYSGLSLDSVFVGYYDDADIGCFANDYIGSNVEKGYTYYYSGELFDNSCVGSIGSEDNLISLGSGFLKGPKKDPNGNDDPIGVGSLGSASGIGFNDGIADNEYLGLETSIWLRNPSIGSPNPLMIVPSTPELGFKQISLSGDVAPLYTSGDGSSVISRVEFPYYSDPTFYSSYGVDPGQIHSEELDGTNAGDRSGLSASGPVTFNPNDTINILTYIAASLPYANVSLRVGVHQLEAIVDSIRSYYENNLTSCGQTFDYYEPFDGPYPNTSLNEETNKKAIVYPNPFNQSLTIESDLQIFNIYLYDLMGRKVYTLESIDNIKTSLDLSFITNGNYILKVQTSEGFETFKVSKF